MPDNFLIVVGGPTGVGKTKVAIDLALHYQTEIINADSRQVYAEMNIGVGKPDETQLNAIPHHLIGHVSIHQAYSAGQFALDALPIIEKLFSLHQFVILTGGTGLYLKAIMEGLDEFPDVPDSTVNHWTSVWKSEGIETLLKALHKLDPEYLKIVDTQNPMRLIRALSVSDATGKPYSSFRSKDSTSRNFTTIPIVLSLPRTELYERINQRVLDMINQGWIDEARTLFPYKNLKSLNTVGYKELFEVLEGNMTLEEAIPKIQQSTRNYAKRQITWWNNQGEWMSFHPDDIKAMINKIDQIKIT
jgi:tRNA dimethylallyltransferase